VLCRPIVSELVFIIFGYRSLGKINTDLYSHEDKNHDRQNRILPGQVQELVQEGGAGNDVIIPPSGVRILPGPEAAGRISGRDWGQLPRVL